MSNLGENQKGVMADVAASPNDPIFINHHTMIDCILEEWLRVHPDAYYPSVTLRGHQKDGYIVPFYPLFKHKDMFKTAHNFGYSCNLPNITVSEIAPTGLGWPVVSLISVALFLLVTAFFFSGGILFCYYCCGCCRTN